MSEKLFYTMGEVTEMFDVNSSLLRYWESRFKQLQPKRNNKGNRLYRPEDVKFIKLLYHLLKERGMTIEGARKSLQERSADELSRESELFERLQYIRQLLVEVRETLMDDPDKTMAEEEAEADNEIENRIGSRNRNGNKNENRSEPQPVTAASAEEAPLGLIVEAEEPLPAPVPKSEPDYASMPALVRPTEPDPEVIVVTDADLAGELPTAAAPVTPAGTSAKVPANVPVDTPADAPIEQLAETSADTPVEDPAEEPADEPDGQPAETSADQSELPEFKRRRRGRKEDAEPDKELFPFYEQRLF